MEIKQVAAFVFLTACCIPMGMAAVRFMDNKTANAPPAVALAAPVTLDQVAAAMEADRQERCHKMLAATNVLEQEANQTFMRDHNACQGETTCLAKADAERNRTEAKLNAATDDACVMH